MVEAPPHLLNAATCLALPVQYLTCNCDISRSEIHKSWARSSYLSYVSILYNEFIYVLPGSLFSADHLILFHFQPDYESVLMRRGWWSPVNYEHWVIKGKSFWSFLGPRMTIDLWQILIIKPSPPLKHVLVNMVNVTPDCSFCFPPLKWEQSPKVWKSSFRAADTGQQASSMHKEIIYAQPPSEIPAGCWNGALPVEWWWPEQKSIDHRAARQVQASELSSLRIIQLIISQSSGSAEAASQLCWLKLILIIKNSVVQWGFHSSLSLLALIYTTF